MMSIKPKSFLKGLATAVTICATLAGDSVHADTLACLESHSDWIDVTNQSSVGIWSKVDIPTAVTTEGELVTAPQHGTEVQSTVAKLLDLPTESQYASGADGANDSYANDSHLHNSNSDIIASVGMDQLVNANFTEVYSSIDGSTWSDAGLIADSSLWNRASLTLDLASMTTSIGFTDAPPTPANSESLTSSSEIADTVVTMLNPQKVDDSAKKYFDDLSLAVAAPRVHEPSSAVVMAIGFLAVGVRRRGK